VPAIPARCPPASVEGVLACQFRPDGLMNLLEAFSVLPVVLQFDLCHSLVKLQNERRICLHGLDRLRRIPEAGNFFGHVYDLFGPSCCLVSCDPFDQVRSKLWVAGSQCFVSTR
jgi:hypothetical protein